MAAALVGGALLSAALQVLFDRLASKKMLDFIKEKNLSRNSVENLEIKLLSLSKVLSDAEKKQIHDPEVKKWVNTLKDAAFDADDILDEIATEAEKASNSGTVPKKLFPISFNSYYRDLENRLEEILKRLGFIVAEKDNLGLVEGNVDIVSQIVPTTSLVDEVFGREMDKKVIMELLLEEDDSSGSKIGVIPIVGIGGVGKTTLAQLVYNDNKVEEHFGLKAWIDVSQQFDVSHVTKMILAVTGLYNYDLDDLNLLQVKLKEKLLKKRFLIVLDGVWNAKPDDWELFCRPLQIGDQGSKIIVTTRHETVALKVGTVETYFLKELGDEDCLRVFAKHALLSRSAIQDQNIHVIYGEIAKKCRGLPLAAKALGGLLRSIPSVDDWYKILKREIWQFSDEELGIIPALKLSYYYLPSHLKRCFAYCSIFPKGYVYDKEQIILLWMAENFIETPNQGLTMEEVGDQYFNELVSRSFFQKSSFHKSQFMMHDLINDLARDVFGEFCSKLEDKFSPPVMEKTRHISFLRDNYDLDLVEDLKMAKRLRTFLSLNLLWPFLASTSQEVPVDHLTVLTCLRVLSLNDCYEIKRLSKSIGNLIHLRYLDVSRTSITKLPESVCTLYNLQTLKAAKCASLRKLPKNLRRLVNLRYLDIRGTPLQQMPKKINKLVNLKMLSTFVVGKNKGSTIQELKEISKLHGSLSINKLQNVAGSADASNAKLVDKEFLEELKLNWDGTTGLKDSQEEINLLNNLRPHENLKKLSLHYYRGTRFPNWLGNHSFHSLTSMSLNCCRYCNSLPPLGQLPSLKVLEILQFDELVTIGNEFYGSSALKPFPSLEILKFICLPAWTKWHSLRDKSFPCLYELHIENCPSLSDDLPRQLQSLVKLVIRDCQKLAASIPKAPALQEMEISNCDKVVLKEIPSNLESFKVKGCELMQSTFKALEYTGSRLQSLEMSSCSRDIMFPQLKLPSSLRKLIVQDCEKLVIPTEQPNKTIEWISISESCDSLVSFPMSMFPNLSYLFLKGCKALTSLLLSQNCLQFPILYSLSIVNCPAFVCCGNFSAPNLTHLLISGCKSLISLPENMDFLMPSLQTLIIYKCPKIEYFPGGSLPSGLAELQIGYCDKLVANRSDWNLQRAESLEIFSIIGRCENVESFPDDDLLPANVAELFIDGFVHLKRLNGKGLENLDSLLEFNISMCPQIQSLPEEGLPNTLKFLSIWGCPLLRERCKKDIGEDWPKISHIPFITIDE
ncbi:putative disease resistance RPP13-like protein 1 [Arachis hypogaea]|uniref:putative disease resistance RPP13-like protein 1 n=1 Tax=Arachis hypogaea TaxID=3818 RepID=UPI000DECEB5B|nr:putative disease resistance RPP13-like protein 1 [Arachis hypogaea]QHO53632.1 Putative disease resistance RPP13-like protein [Arachis hypogaea]